MSIPSDLRYTREHEWARLEGDTVVIGITDHAQEALGDVVYVELPEPGAALTAGKTFGVVESVKAVSDLYAPCDGEVVEVNTELSGSPGTVNGEAYGRGWLVRVRPSNPAQIDALLDAAAYEALLAATAV